MNSDRMRSVILSIDAFVAAAIAVVSPLGYLGLSYYKEVERLAFVAEQNAARVSRYIYQHEALWQFHSVRLSEIIELPGSTDAEFSQRVFTDRQSSSWSEAT